MHIDVVIPPSPKIASDVGQSVVETSSIDHSAARTLLPDSDPLDLMYRVVGMYRLLDLISETGSGGAGSWVLGAPIRPDTHGLSSVDKIMIDQPSIEALANKLSPGSYTSMTKVNPSSIAHRE